MCLPCCDYSGQFNTYDIFKCISFNENFVFRLKFHWSLFLRVQLTIVHHWFRWWFGAVQAPNHYLNQWWWVYWRIYASLGLNELTCISRTKSESTSWCTEEVILKLILVLDICTNVKRNFPQMSVKCPYLYDDSTLDQVSVWRHKASSHYLSQCWPTTESLI